MKKLIAMILVVSMWIMPLSPDFEVAYAEVSIPQDIIDCYQEALKEAAIGDAIMAGFTLHPVFDWVKENYDDFTPEEKQQINHLALLTCIYGIHAYSPTDYFIDEINSIQQFLLSNDELIQWAYTNDLYIWLKCMCELGDFYYKYEQYEKAMLCYQSMLLDLDQIDWKPDSQYQLLYKIYQGCVRTRSVASFNIPLVLTDDAQEIQTLFSYDGLNNLCHSPSLQIIYAQILLDAGCSDKAYAVLRKLDGLQDTLEKEMQIRYDICSFQASWLSQHDGDSALDMIESAALLCDNQASPVLLELCYWKLLIQDATSHPDFLLSLKAAQETEAFQNLQDPISQWFLNAITCMYEQYLETINDSLMKD